MLEAMKSKIVRIGKKGVIVIPKDVREALGIQEGSPVEVRLEGDKIIIRRKDLWEEIAKRGVKINAEDAERELDEAEEEWLRRL